VSRIRRALILAVVLLQTPPASGGSGPLWSAELSVRETGWSALVDSVGSRLQLPDRFLTPSSERITIDGRPLTRGENYRIDYRTGTVEVLRPPHGRRLIVRYRALPLGIRLDYRIRRPPPPGDAVDAEPESVPTDTRAPLDDTGGALLVQGTKTVSISLGTNRDLSLDQSLRLSLQGTLPQGVEVEAVLSDENLPIQPEGTTQELEELDQVKINVRKGGLQATLGDYVLESSGYRFATLSRKLQGARVTGQSSTALASVALASSRGEFASVEFVGSDSKQGPYRLVDYLGSGDLTVGGIVILAGTEEVWLNGIAMVRGADRDYVADYAQGTITFTENRLITAESRIAVDFEYSNRKYRRTSYYTEARVGGPEQPYGLRAVVVREGDDRDAPLEATIGEEEKQALRRAGDDATAARVPSWDFVAPGEGEYDTLTVRYFTYEGPGAGDYDLTMKRVGSGRGDYRARDLAFEYWGPGGGDYEVRNFVAGDGSGMYAIRRSLIFMYKGVDGGTANVAFAGVPQGQGDYRLVAQGQCEYVGPNHGDRTPYRYLPLPSGKNLADVFVSGRAPGGVVVSAEGAWSHTDLNQYSPQDDSDNGGGAIVLSAQQALPRIGIGTVAWKGAYRHQQANFIPLGRTQGADYYRGWNVDAQQRGKEEELSAEIGYRPVEPVELIASMGSLSRAGGVRSRRVTSGIRAGNGTNRAAYTYTRARVLSASSTRLRSHHQGELLLRRGMLTPHMEVEAEESTGDDVSGTAFSQGRAGLGLALGQRSSVDVWWEGRRQRVAPQGIGWLEEFTARSIGQTLQLRGRGWGSCQLQFTRRHKEYANRYLTYLQSVGGVLPAPSTSHLGRGDISLSTPGNSASLSINYRARDEEIRRLVEELVPEGEQEGGEYDSTGAWVGSELGTHRKELVPVGDPESASEVTAGVRARLQPDRMAFIKRFAPPISWDGEVRARLSATSRDRWGVYLLLPRVFRRDEETLRSDLQWRNALRFPTRPRAFSGVLELRRALDRDNRYQNRHDKSRSTDVSVSLRLSPGPGLAVKVDGELDRETQTREGRSFRVRERSAKLVLQKPSRPGLGGALETVWELAEVEETTQAQPGRSWGWGCGVSPSISAGSVAGWAVELGWQVWYREFHGPWESIRMALRRSERDGVTHTARGRLDYRVSKHTSVNLTYQGTRNPGSRFLHQGSMEVRALF
jgi:hypothetical protein